MPHGRQARLFNFFAVVFLGLSILSLGWEVNIAMNPYGRLNPFPPPTLYPTPTSVAALLPFAVMVVLMLLALSVFALRIYAGVSVISGQDFRYPILGARLEHYLARQG